MAILQGDADAVSATRTAASSSRASRTQGVDAVMIDLRGNGGGLLERGDLALGPVHRQGPGRPGQGGLRRPAPRRRRRGHGLGRPAGRPDRPLQRQRLGDLRGRDQGLRPRPDHRRLEHLRQGDRAEHRRRSTSIAPPAATTRRASGALKLTIQQFYRVNGESTQIKGVTPDIHIPSIRDQADFGEGKMDNALKFDKVDGAAARPVQPRPRRPGRPARKPLGGPPQGRPQVPEAGRADQEVRSSARPGTRSR